MLFRRLVLLFSFIILSACSWQPVKVVDPLQFKLLADRMPTELEARDMIDSDRDYIEGTWEEVPQNYGERLFHDLSPSVIFDNTVGKNTYTSFAQSVQKGDTVAKKSHGFTLIHNHKKRSERRLDVDMVAISDWDNDGKKDWIVACTLKRTKAANPRIYYVVVANPPIQGALRARTVAVYDDLGVIGRLYMHSSEANVDAPVEDVVPGLRSVTTPPSQQNSSQKKDGVQERSLD